MKKELIENSFTVYEEEDMLDEARMHLLNEAFKAIQTSHAPYSDFHVGSALELKNGEIILGSNQENASFPEGLCAERVALYSAAARYPGIAPLRLAIVTSDVPRSPRYPAAPCGGCRQTILEYHRLHDQAIELLLRSSSGPILQFESVLPLLPLSFDQEYLK